MLRRVAVVVLLAVLGACARRPVTSEVTIEMEPNDRALVTARTTFRPSDAQTPAQLSRVETARFDAIHGNDDWSARFGRVSAEDDEVTYRRHRGELEQVTRAIRIPVAQLQQVFSDTNITVNQLNGPGWRELAFYPGGSMRATRDQQRHFENALDTWSGSVAHYFMAIDPLYTYLSVNPHRATDVFAALLGDEVGVLEEEQPLIEAVAGAMEDIAQKMDDQTGEAATFSEEADLVYNPFPARVVLRVPGEVTSRSGFGEELVIEPIDLMEAVRALEGKWISPDPLAALVRDETTSAAALAQQPRMSTRVVNAKEIADAIRVQMQRPESYVVRWREN